MNKRCLGCGALLQNSDENNLGFTPNLANSYCKRCFRLKNYGELKVKSTVDIKKVLNKVNKSGGMALFLIDYLNINKETINYFKSIKIEKALVISKCDILRKEMKQSKISKWLKDIYNINEDILYISNSNSYKSSNILEFIKEKNFQDIFIMGITNAGKSTFINKLIKKDKILVSDRENTTLDFIKLKIDNYNIYDTPGFSYTNLGSISKSLIKPISYVIKGGVSIVINNKYKIYFKECNKVILYLNIDDIKKEYKKDVYKNKVKVYENSDLVLPGLGFINIKNECLIETNFDVFELRKDISGD